MDTNRSASRYYTELYYHVVWGTYNRHPMLRAGVQEDVYRFLVYKCEGYGYQLFAVNGMEDHIHLVLRLRPSVCVSEMISKLKGSSAWFCNQTLMPTSPIQWQGGYGAFTFSKRNLSKISSYVQHQKQRHRTQHFAPQARTHHLIYLTFTARTICAFPTPGFILG